MRGAIAVTFGAGFAMLGFLFVTGDHKWLWLGVIIYIIGLLVYRPKGQLSLWEGLTLPPDEQERRFVQRQEWYQINRNLRNLRNLKSMEHDEHE